MRIIGQWPYQSTGASRSFLAIFLLLTTTQAGPRIMSIIKYHDNLGIVLESSTVFIYIAACAARLICCIINSQKVSCIPVNLDSLLILQQATY